MTWINLKTLIMNLEKILIKFRVISSCCFPFMSEGVYSNGIVFYITHFGHIKNGILSWPLLLCSSVGFPVWQLSNSSHLTCWSGVHLTLYRQIAWIILVLSHIPVKIWIQSCWDLSSHSVSLWIPCIHSVWGPMRYMRKGWHGGPLSKLAKGDWTEVGIAITTVQSSCVNSCHYWSLLHECHYQKSPLTILFLSCKFSLTDASKIKK